MVALYVTSVEAGAGKTTICAGLGKHLLAKRKRVGFLKPLVNGAGKNLLSSSGDAPFMKQILALEEPAASLSPVISDGSNLAGRLTEAYARVALGKEVVIIEGPCDRNVVEALAAKVITIEAYTGKSSQFTTNYKALEGHLLGVVLTKVPQRQFAQVRSDLSAMFTRAGINVLGVVPEDRLLFTMTVGELANYLQGEILNSEGNSTELVENFMLGAMAVDPGTVYFSRKSNKAVVVRGGRTDIQLAALETSTRCLVLCGDTPPSEALLAQAKRKKVPIILAKSNALDAVLSIEEGLTKTRFHQEKKLPRLMATMEQHFNFPAVYQGLGIAS